MPELFVPSDLRRVPHQDETDAVAARCTAREGLSGHARDVVIARVSSVVMDGINSRFFDFIARFPRILHSPRNLITVSSDRSHDLVILKGERECFEKKTPNGERCHGLWIAAVSTVSLSRPRIVFDGHRMLWLRLGLPGRIVPRR